MFHNPKNKSEISAEGLKRHDQDSNPHSANQKYQSFSSMLQIAVSRHAIEVRRKKKSGLESKAKDGFTLILLHGLSSCPRSVKQLS